LGLALVVAASPPPPQTDPRTVAETYTSEPRPEEDVDSLAVWHGPENQHWVIATAKATHRLLVFDASTGTLLRIVGKEGGGPGEFRRPNGIAILDDTVFVVERDNHRVQVLSLPKLESVATFGGEVLKRPYGIAAHSPRAGETYEIYVTDNYMEPNDEPPPAASLGDRVRHFRAERHGSGLRFSEVRAIGDTEGAGVLYKVETIASDPDRDRLLVADEYPVENYFKLYHLDGRFFQRGMGQKLFQIEPEGLVLYPCGSGGFWFGTDQHEARSHFLVFDRDSLAYLGAFSGTTTANTDGVALTTVPFGPFQGGAFFAVHDDSALSSFSLSKILEALELSCP
jgi:3-phytase